MEERQKVYIKGVPYRGKEVIKKLTDRGGDNRLSLKGDDPGYIYFISHNRCIASVSLGSEMCYLIIDNYYKLNLYEEKWKDGDILINKERDTFVVFSYYLNPDYSFYARLQVSGNTYQEYQDRLVCHKADYSLADQKQIEKFRDLLHKCWKEWDAESNTIVDYRSDNQTRYYYVTDSCDVETGVLSDNTDVNRFRAGNFFYDCEKARETAKEIKKLLQEKQDIVDRNCFDEDDSTDKHKHINLKGGISVTYMIQPKN